MTTARQPIPDGAVSTIRGRLLIPALTWLVRIVLVVSVIGGLLGGSIGRGLSTAAVVAVVAAPPARVCWLLFRWAQERDRGFVALGIAVLAVIATGAVLAASGVGG